MKMAEVRLDLHNNEWYFKTIYQKQYNLIERKTRHRN